MLVAAYSTTISPTDVGKGRLAFRARPGRGLFGTGAQR